MQILGASVSTAGAGVGDNLASLTDDAFLKKQKEYREPWVMKYDSLSLSSFYQKKKIKKNAMSCRLTHYEYNTVCRITKIVTILLHCLLGGLTPEIQVYSEIVYDNRELSSVYLKLGRSSLPLSNGIVTRGRWVKKS